MPVAAEHQSALGAAIRNLRRSKGMTQEELALRCDLDLTWIGRIERGQANPTWTTTKRIARELDVPHSQLAVLEEAVAEG